MTLDIFEPPGSSMFPPALRHLRHTHRIAAVAALLLGAVVLAPSAQATTKGGVRLRVMAYNIQAGAGTDHVFDLERQARAIESEHPDLVGLEEVDVDWAARSDYTDEATWLARRLHMHVFFAPIYDLPPDRAGAPDRRFGVTVVAGVPIVFAHDHDNPRLSPPVPGPVPAPGPGLPPAPVSG